MASRGHYVNGNADPQPLHWSEFCEEQAAFAASDFYRNFRTYLHENPDLSVRDTATSFLNRFIDCLQSDFYQCVERGQPVKEPYSRGFESVESFSQDRSSPNSSGDPETHKQSKARSFLRRLSFRKKNRNKELKEGSAEDDSRSKSKQRSNIKKEGIVYRLTENTPTGAHKWEKCRLVLVNNPSGFLLECYAPPKVMYQPCRCETVISTVLYTRKRAETKCLYGSPIHILCAPKN